MFLSCLYKSFSLFYTYIVYFSLSCLYTSLSLALSPHRFSDDLDLEDALHIAILALKEGFEGLMSATNIEIGVTHEGRFHILTPEQISEYLTNI